MTLEEQLNQEAAVRHEAYIAQIEAMIAAYRNGKTTVSDTMYEIVDLVNAQFNAPRPDPWDED